MSDTITFRDAVTRYQIPEKLLAGRCARNLFEDPHVVDCTEGGEYVLLDDWRLARLKKCDVSLAK